MTTEEVAQKKLLQNLNDNKESAQLLFDQFMDDLKEKVMGGCHGVNSETPPLSFEIEGPDDKGGLDIKSDKYHIYIEPQPSSVADGGSLVVCYGKLIEDEQSFSIHHHWIKTLHLSKPGLVTFHGEPAVIEQELTPDIYSLPIDWIFNSDWPRYLFSLTKANIKIREDYDTYLEGT